MLTTSMFVTTTVEPRYCELQGTTKEAMMVAGMYGSYILEVVDLVHTKQVFHYNCVHCNRVPLYSCHLYEWL